MQFKKMSCCYRSGRNGPEFERDSGFSLVELLVVIVILAVIGTIGTPWLLAMKTKSSIRADARDVHSAFRQAQTEAVKRSENACVLIDYFAGTYQIQMEDYFGAIVPGKSTMFEEKTLRPGNIFLIPPDDYFTPKNTPLTCYNFRGLPEPLPPGQRSIRVGSNNNALVMEVRMTPAGHVGSTDYFP